MELEKFKEQLNKGKAIALPINREYSTIHFCPYCNKPFKILPQKKGDDWKMRNIKLSLKEQFFLYRSNHETLLKIKDYNADLIIKKGKLFKRKWCNDCGNKEFREICTTMKPKEYIDSQKDYEKRTERLEKKLKVGLRKKKKPKGGIKLDFA